jgi:flagellar biosynthesis protein FlgN
MSMSRPAEMGEALQAVLLDMRHAVDTLAHTLEDEREAISNGDSHALDCAGAAKQTLMHSLEQLDIERRQLAHEAPGAAQALAAAWDDIVATLRQCHQLNLRNGSAVNQRLGQVRQALSILTGHAGESGLYGRAGELRASLRSQVLAEA